MEEVEKPASTDLVLKQQMRLIRANVLTAQLTYLSVTLITAMLAWGKYPWQTVSGWIGAALVIAALRLFAAIRFKDAEPVLARNISIVSALGAGAVWGAASLLFLDDANAQFKMILLAIVAGLSAGAMSALASIMRVYVAFSAPAILTMSVVLLLSDDPEWRTVGVLTILFFFAMLSLARGYNASLKRAIMLRIENESLLETLTREKQQTEQARDAAEKANHAKSEFLSRMSHELRTPLNAVIGFSELMSINSDKEPLTQSQRDAVKYIGKAGQHLLSLVNEVLDLAKIEAGKLQLDLALVSPGEIVSESITLLASVAQERGIDIRFRNDCDERKKVLVDPTRLKQVMLNLLSNGIKYNRDSGTLLVSCLESVTDKVRIEVTDQGDGIPLARMPELFVAFNRLDAGNSGVEGTGIGLVVTKRLIEAMDGEIGCVSRRGKGCTFWIEVPAVVG